MATNLGRYLGRMIITFIVIGIEVIFFFSINISTHTSGISKTPVTNMSGRMCIVILNTYLTDCNSSLGGGSTFISHRRMKDMNLWPQSGDAANCRINGSCFVMQ